jgi:hypothetical protein
MGLRFLATMGALALCMAPADEGGAGGGGGGEGGGGAGGGDAPKYVTIDQVNEVLNKALGSRDKRLMDGLGKSLDERFAKLSETLPKPSDEGGGGGGEGAGGKKVDPELVKLRQQQEAMQKRLEAADKRVADAEAKTRAEKVRTQLHGALSKVARPETVGVLLDAFTGKVQFDETGDPSMPLSDGSGVTTIDAWVENWSKSNDAKAFLPAPSSGGAGTQRGSGGGATRTGNYKNKPREQWTQDDVNEAFTDFNKSNAERAI